MQVMPALVPLRVEHTVGGRQDRSLHPYKYFICKCVIEHQHLILLPRVTQPNGRTSVWLFACALFVFTLKNSMDWCKLCVVKGKRLLYDLTMSTEDSFLLSESPVVCKKLLLKHRLCKSVQDFGWPLKFCSWRLHELRSMRYDTGIFSSFVS